MVPAHERHEAPSREGLQRMTAAMFADARVASVTPLRGGIAAATHLLDLLTADRAERRLVLKRYPPGDETPALEWERLGCAARVALPTPERVALDREGSWFGSPALLMSALPGRVELHPSDLDGWTRQLAHALAEIHRTELGDAVPAALRRPQLYVKWQPWETRADDRIAAGTEAIRRLQREPLREREVFCHDDFHPGNVLFERGILSGIVDWSSARLAPAAADVANCRMDLAIAPGAQAPDLFLAHYRAASPESLERLPLWDTLSGMRALQWGHLWLEAFAGVGLDLSAEQVRSAAETFLDDALGRC